MKILIQNGAVTLSGKSILTNINFEINDNEKIAIVGRNGAGKTTLLNALIDNSLLEEGIDNEEFKIINIGNYKIGYLKQITFKDENIVIDELTSAFDELINIENKLSELESNLNDSNVVLYNKLLDSYKLLGGYTYKKDIEVMLDKFGFSEKNKYKQIKEFSGGERTKLAFIKLLLSKPELLIMDEPTNHLDISTIEWLENYLKNYKGSIIIVSHDRMFIDNIATIIYDIEYGKTIKYKCNYSKYIKLKEDNYDKNLKEYDEQQKEIKRLNTIYEKFRCKPTKAKMALSKLRQIEKMDIIIKPNKIDDRTFKVNLKNIIEPSKVVLKIKSLNFGYDKILGSINLEVLKGRKIGIIGSNGTGKSTLLKTLNKMIKPINGEITYGYQVKSEYFDQSLHFFTNDTVLNEFMNKSNNMNIEESRSALGSFLFKGEDVNKKLSVLSGGEKVRLQLCEIFYSKPNLMFLDEPTNHLDIIGKTYLEKILKEYTGTVIFVSHDRYFVKEIADELLVFENNKVNYYKYGYQEYIEKNKEIKININKNDLNKKVSILEKEIDALNNKINKLNQELYKEEVYSDIMQVENINKDIDKLNNELKIKEKNWEDLTDRLLNS